MAKTSQAQIRAIDKYRKENMRCVQIKFNRKTEPELAGWIDEQDNIQGYIKSLILADMKIKKGQRCDEKNK